MQEKPAIGYLLLIVVTTLVAFGLLWAALAIWS